MKKSYGLSDMRRRSYSYHRRIILIDRNFDRCEVSSTHLAHRLMTYALRNDPASQLPLAMNLFEAHHLDGQHLSDRDFLTYQAMLFNLFPSGTQARQWLDSDECDAEVRRAYASAHRLGVTGVPFFVFQQKYAASGAMGVDEFVKVRSLLYGLSTCSYLAS